ncbi:M15 family metallopeptidase [Marinobacter sp. X15-166B]|uniref:M15 family metallopeptidase n=1 Tax=Marinobacter sp. X15-166B TaxID=1897620 RepID=UPI000A71EB5C|nr:M15 family metallopeptidase [Marinobacter sp. X15-166B]
MPDWNKYQATPIHESSDPLVPVSVSKKVGVYPAYYKMNVANAVPECYVRAQVFERLLHAASLLPEDIQLVVLDGWRPFSVQQYLFDTLIDLIRQANTYLSHEQVELEARNLVSPPSANPRAPSPHLTGGSVDVTLADLDGRFLDMGTLFDEASPLSWTCALERKNRDPKEQQARDNRRLLYSAMSKAGFTNLPSEWWHYDYGNQLWAYHSGADAAAYGAVTLPGIDQLWQNQLTTHAASR